MIGLRARSHPSGSACAPELGIYAARAKVYYDEIRGGRSFSFKFVSLPGMESHS